MQNRRDQIEQRIKKTEDNRDMHEEMWIKKRSSIVQLFAEQDASLERKRKRQHL